jgi:lipopolysaccharide export LptBFGC system permease protein LptF
MSVGASFGNSGSLPPMLAAWLANLVFTAASVVVLIRLQKAV